jgi:RimJ/RimL family protein N-acetyltransferase
MGQLSYPDPPLTDGVVALRPWEDGDVEFVVRACQDERLSRYSPSIAFPYVEADARAWFASHEPMRLQGEGMDLAVVEAESGTPLGAIALVNVSWRDMRAETGYWLAPEARHHGYASRAVRLIVRWAFDQLQMLRIELKADSDNLESQRVAQRCGFRREGRLRSHMVILHSGERRDSLIFGLLSGELT